MRLVIAISIDGRLAPASGKKTNLGGCGDRKALEKSLAWSDAALMGGGTLRTHKSTCLIHSKDLIKKRLSKGKSEQPIAIVASSLKDDSPEWPFFQQPIKRWLIHPKSLAKGQDNDYINTFNFDKNLISEDDWTKDLSKLFDHGISRLVLLGGTRLITSFLRSDYIDELQLSIVPKILGGSYTWTDPKLDHLVEGLGDGKAWKLTKIKELGEEEILLKYKRNRPI